VRGKYRDVILPFTVLRRLDAVLQSTKQAVLERKKFLDTHKVAERDGALRMAAGQAFSNTSEFTLATLTASGQGQRLRDNFVDYLDGFDNKICFWSANLCIKKHARVLFYAQISTNCAPAGSWRGQSHRHSLRNSASLNF